MATNKIHELGIKYGTDKITHHEYHKIYDFFLRSFYTKKGSMLEIGIESGSSLHMWLELFPNAYIYGMDIGKEYIGIRHNIIKGDQSNLDDLTRVKNTINDIFFINDDGSHVPEHQILTFNTLFPTLCEGGVYIIEDIEVSYWASGGLYGYPTRYGYKHPDSIVEIFKDVADSVNSEFAGKRSNRVHHHDKIASITFSRNCIIIVKNTQQDREYRFKSNLMSPTVTPPTVVKRLPKIAIWTGNNWAMGKIHNDLIQYMSKWYDFHFYDWCNCKHNTDLWDGKEWKNYDIILGTTTVTSELVKFRGSDILTQQLLDKFIAVAHYPIFNHPHFTEIVTDYKGVTHGGISQEVVDNMEREFGVKSNLLPTGINLTNFYPTRVIKSILKIGFVGNPNCGISHWCSNKRPDMFLEICAQAGVEAVCIYGKPYTLYGKLYDDIDMLICTSLFEGAGQGIMEAGACNIPVISTKAGYAKYLTHIKTFETVEEAVEIIKYYQDHPDELVLYANMLGDEIRGEWNCDLICEKYWKTVIDGKLKDNNKINYDFIEIGTSDFDYNSDVTKKGLLFEPVPEYYDRLVCGPNTIKTKCAVTYKKAADSCDIYYIPSDTIIKENLPQWMKGCNCINTYHAKHQDYKNLVAIEKVQVMDVSEIYEMFNIGHVKYIKIDTEGHDCVIMDGFYNQYKNIDKRFYPETIKFESNEWNNPADVLDIIEKFKSLGYDANTGYDTILTLH